MNYGYFDDKNREYVITRPDTPLPWINYLGSEEYCALFSNTAGGYSFCVDPRYRRLIRYRYNNVPTDRGGRYYYIRDNKTKDFWSPTWQPVLKDLKKFKYECRHGTGYSVVFSEYSGISTRATYFVPLGENCEVCMLEVKNISKNKKRDLTVFSFLEFCLWDALNDMTDYQYNLNIGQTDYTKGIIWHLTRYRVEKSFFAYFACANQEVASFDSDRDAFLGPYGSFENPRAVIVGKGSNSIACGWSPVGSHCVPIKLSGKKEQSLIFVLGYNDDKKAAKRVVKKFNSKAKVEKELKKLKKYWEKDLSRFTARTEDEDMALMVNTWNQYQCRTTFNWSRSASYYESGIGRGMGFRDSNQDTLGFVHIIPDKVKERIVDLASTQFENGSANHQYQPLTKKGAGGGFSDDHLWLVVSTASYLKETGDFGFLSKKVPFENGKKVSLYEHLAKAIEFTMDNLGPHGIPKMFSADWNDCLNLPGTKGCAESVMVGQQLVYVAKEMEKIARYADKPEDSARYKKIAEEMADQINRVAWDGSWYLRAFTDDADFVGSSKCKEGKIYLETQPWAVMSGVADKGRAKKCMDSVNKKLSSEHGIMILQPAYKEYLPELGTIGFYPPGLKENGGIFCHPNPWAMIAECMLGRGDRAFEYYKAILPSARNKIADIHRTEPYVYCQMIAGKDHVKFGEGKNSWLTGSACWNFVAASQWILGVRADYEGLIVDPCIPKKWKGFEVKRTFRGIDYYITVRNPGQVSKGVAVIAVDGEKINSGIIPVFKDDKDHFVEVTMG